MHMKQANFKRYNHKKNHIIEQILNVLEYKYGYETLDLIILSKELRLKPLRYLVWYKQKLIQNI